MDQDCTDIAQFAEYQVLAIYEKLKNRNAMKIGDRMPSFEVKDQDGRTIKSEDLIGKGSKIVLYTYPKDSTPGCTAEACSFRDRYDQIGAAGYNLIGISKDSENSHVRFREKYSLPFTLLSDTDTTLLQALGAWGEKKLYGKVSFGTLRKTCVFSEDGVLERIIEKVDTKNAAAQLLGEK